MLSQWRKSIWIEYIINNFHDIPELAWLMLALEKDHEYIFDIFDVYEQLVEKIVHIKDNELAYINAARQYMSEHGISPSCWALMTTQEFYDVIDNLQTDHIREWLYDVSADIWKTVMWVLYDLVKWWSDAYAYMKKNNLDDIPRDFNEKRDAVIWTHTRIDQEKSTPGVFFHFLSAHYISQFFRATFPKTLIWKDDFFKVMNDVILLSETQNEFSKKSELYDIRSTPKQEWWLWRLRGDQLQAYKKVLEK